MPLSISKRLPQWSFVLREEGRELTWWGKIKTAFHILTKAIGLGHVDRSTWRRRMRTCWMCPLYDRANKRCRPFTGYDGGCGCYTPLLALSKEGCWGYENPGYCKFHKPRGSHWVRGWGPVPPR